MRRIADRLLSSAKDACTTILLAAVLIYTALLYNVVRLFNKDFYIDFE